MEDLHGQRSTNYRGVVVDAVAQAAFNEKKWVWVEDKEEGYIAGWISREDSDQVDVHLNNGLVRTHSFYSLTSVCLGGNVANLLLLWLLTL